MGNCRYVSDITDICHVSWQWKIKNYLGESVRRTRRNVREKLLWNNQNQRKGESVSRDVCDKGSAALSGLDPLFQTLFSCGSPSSQQVLPAWLSPLSCKSSFWSAGCFSLLLIHFFLLPVPSCCQSILQSPSPRFSQLLAECLSLGIPLQTSSQTNRPLTSHKPRFTVLQDGNGKAVGYWGLVFTF